MTREKAQRKKLKAEHSTTRITLKSHGSNKREVVSKGELTDD